MATEDRNCGGRVHPRGLAVKLDKSIRAKDVIRTLADLFSERGAPVYIRSGNGPEFVEKALKKWLTPAFSLAVERLEIRMARSR